MERRRSCQSDERMLVHFAAPEQHPGRGVHGVDVALLIGKLRSAAAFALAAGVRGPGHRS